MSQMTNNSPIYFGCKNLSGGDNHAIVCRGYNTTGSKAYISIWNPWCTKYEKMDALDGTYTTTGGTKFKWSTSIYGWRKY